MLLVISYFEVFVNKIYFEICGFLKKKCLILIFLKNFYLVDRVKEFDIVVYVIIKFLCYLVMKYIVGFVCVLL